VPRPADIPVLIAGAGPTGLTLAAELLRHGLPCRIVDRAPAPSDRSKAIAIQARTLELLEPLGVSEELVATGIHARVACVYAQGEPLGEIELDGLDSAYPYMLLVPQPDTERALAMPLARWGVTPERGVELASFTHDDDGVTALLHHPDGRREEVRASWLAGCDGAHSIVRQSLGLQFPGHTFVKSFVLADVRIEWDRPADVIQLFSVRGALLGVFPLPGGRARIIADEPAFSAGSADPTLAECQAVMDERAAFPARLSDPRWTARFRVNSRVVSSLVSGRVLLAGDAAHIHSPAGGQGMNTGIQDAINVAWKLAMVERGLADLALIATYDAERHPVDRAVLRTTDFLLQTMAARRGPRAFLRDHLARYVAASPLVQQRLRRTLSQLAVEYRGSPLAEERALRGGPRAGDRAPDALGTGTDGARQSVARACATTRHTLLVLHAACTPTEHEGDALAEGRGDWLTAVSLADPMPGTVPAGWPRPLDEVYGTERPCVYLIRPDGYVGMRAPLARASDALDAYAGRLGLRVTPRPAT